MLAAPCIFPRLLSSLLFPSLGMAEGAAAQPKGQPCIIQAWADLVWLIFNPPCAWGGWSRCSPCSVWCIMPWWILYPSSSGYGQEGSAPQVHQGLSSWCESVPPALPCTPSHPNSAVGWSHGHNTRTRRVWWTFEQLKGQEEPTEFRVSPMGRSSPIRNKAMAVLLWWYGCTGSGPSTSFRKIASPRGMS